MCKVLYTLCKVRGEKVIVSFFSNEARYLEPILAAYESLTTVVSEETEDGWSSWEERYVLLLWLYHLMLVPFDLASVSSVQPVDVSHVPTTLLLPASLPSVVCRLLPACLRCLGSATKERGAAALVLVRMVLRPDMRRMGLQDDVISWALTELKHTSDVSAQIHQRLGILSFLSGLTSSGSPDEIQVHLSAIYKACQTITESDALTPLRSSAVARKLVIKLFRNIVLLCLKSPAYGLDQTTVLEEVIEFLLNALADGDSPVRYAASKAMSMVALKLDATLADEVIEALLACLSEDVLWEGSSRNLTAVNPLRWHGLTLTLGHLLYRRAPSPSKLPDLINALVLSLQFEQRSATGSSLGTNVRDAACFGIWGLSRRYTTAELLAVSVKSIRAADGTFESDATVPYYLATQLLIAACLDPAGNIRRGSSAALQELTGRHPNIIIEGISLVQVVDYHAVGLRERAMVSVAFQAASLDKRYWEVLFSALIDWRGLGSVDAASRAIAARSIGLFCTGRPFARVRTILGLGQGQNESLFDRIRGLKLRQVEERHGLILAIAQVIHTCVEYSYFSNPANSAEDTGLDVSVEDCKALANLFTEVKSLNLQERDFQSASFRPELTVSAVCALLTAMTSAALRAGGSDYVDEELLQNLHQASMFLQLSLTRSEDSVLSAIPDCAKNLCSFGGSGISIRDELIQSWMEAMKPADSRYVKQVSGYTIALGAAFGTLNDRQELQDDIIATLAARSTDQVDIEARVFALQAFRHVIEAIAPLRIPKKRHQKIELDAYKQQQLGKIANSLYVALNDYTVNERGDVGSLVRFEALNTLEIGWKLGIFVDEKTYSRLRGNVIRLSLEKLDKVRDRARWCLEAPMSPSYDLYLVFSSVFTLNSTYSDPSLPERNVSSAAYFAFWLNSVIENQSPDLARAVLEGYISSAGMASESVVQVSRAALTVTLDALPTEEEGNFDLLDVSNVLMSIFKDNLGNDRTLLPLLEILAFLLDMHILQRLDDQSFKYVPTRITCLNFT